MESRDVISATQPENIRTNPVGNEFITQSRLGCDRSRTIFTIFDVRCAIIRTLGVEISRNDIKDRLAPLVGWKCAEASLTDNQFEHMVSIISTERNLKHSRMLYSQFDRGCKGFVTYIDFINTTKQVLPTLCKSGKEGTRKIFDALDFHNTQKIQQQQLESIFEGGDKYS